MQWMAGALVIVAMAAPKPARVDTSQLLRQLSEFNASAPVGQQWPGERQSNDPWLNALMARGQEFWKQRNVNVPTVKLRMSTDLSDGGSDAFARGSKDEIVMYDGWAGQMLKRARDEKRTVRARRDALGDVMSVLFHEMGHAGGLDHSKHGLMSEDYWGHPAFGMSLVRRLIPRR